MLSYLNLEAVKLASLAAGRVPERLPGNLATTDPLCELPAGPLGLFAFALTTALLQVSVLDFNTRALLP